MIYGSNMCTPWIMGESIGQITEGNALCFVLEHFGKE